MSDIQKNLHGAYVEARLVEMRAQAAVGRLRRRMGAKAIRAAEIDALTQYMQSLVHDLEHQPPDDTDRASLTLVRELREERDDMRAENIEMHRWMGRALGAEAAALAVVHERDEQRKTIERLLAERDEARTALAEVVRPIHDLEHQPPDKEE